MAATETKRPFKKREEWIPNTDLGILVKAKKITLDEIFRHSLTIREPEIINHFLGENLKEEILKIRSIQKQTKAGQRTRMKVCVVVGDERNYVGVATASATDVATATRSAIRKAKCSIRRVDLGFWGAKVGEPHTVKAKAKGKCGSVTVNLFPATKGSGIVAGNTVKTIYKFAGIKDVHTSSTGQTSTTENFAMATLDAIENASNYYVPDLWEVQMNDVNPLLAHWKTLNKSKAGRN